MLQAWSEPDLTRASKNKHSMAAFTVPGTIFRIVQWDMLKIRMGS